MRYLHPQQLITNLNLGKSIEQWLGYSKFPDYTIIKRLTIDKENDGEFSVVYFEVFDEGDENFVDIYEFTTVDTDEPYGVVSTFKTPKEALDYSMEKYSCRIDKFVNNGVIQEEYEEYLKNKT